MKIGKTVFDILVSNALTHPSDEGEREEKNHMRIYEKCLI